MRTDDSESLAGDGLGRDGASRGSLCLQWLCFTHLQLKVIGSSPDSSLNTWGCCCYLGAANHPMSSPLSPARSARMARGGRPRRPGGSVRNWPTGVAAGSRDRSGVVRRKRRADRASGWRVSHAGVLFRGRRKGRCRTLLLKCFWDLTLCTNCRRQVS